MMPGDVSLVWFKRDLRIQDHRPLLEASQRGQVLPVYIFEPSVWQAGELDATHLKFVKESLIYLDRQIRQRGGRLIVRIGEVPEVFVELGKSLRIKAIFSHTETGTLLTYERDKRVQGWCRESNVPWHEFSQNGVIRRLKNRDGWAARWMQTMTSSQQPEIRSLETACEVDSGRLPSPEELGLATIPPHVRLQSGGEEQAHATLKSFLNQRSLSYRTAMSSPLSAEAHCSRLSPYLAWGNLSIKQVFQATQDRKTSISRTPSDASRSSTQWKESLSSFSSRLSWHCHFMQKLESEPEMEVSNVCRLYDGLRESEFNEARFDLWKKGQTGFPMIDACMRYLHQHRWINFRMRAMLMSFAAYHLWLHWRKPALFLAQHFLDFEPGIHFPQCQMQSGVTGINTIRIYSPRKQLIDQDPTGSFVRKYVPELEAVPIEFLAAPSKMSVELQKRFGCRIGIDYPQPIVEESAALKYAKNRIYAIRNSALSPEAARAVYEKHGSRKSRERDPLPKSSRRARPKRDNNNSQTPFLPGFNAQ